VVVAALGPGTSPDIAVANGTVDNSPGLVTVLYGNGDGNFLTQKSFDAGINPVGIAAADVNHDGRTDLLVADQAGKLVVLLATGPTGQQTFAAATNFPVGPAGSAPTAVAAGDLNRDGFADAVLADGAAASASVLLGLGNGSFLSSMDLPAGAEPSAVALGDVNGDGLLDIVVSNFLDGTVSVLLNTTK
jgi:hypothetical protein